ncbi:MAG TPA: hypothetical protein VGO75_05510 [Gemmatimonadaceae bacterium]|jgi:hypothetical protein|nr:hypothetical protein [Gemmatimonadaceae bacterium]
MRANNPTIGRTIFLFVDGLSGSDAADLPLREALEGEVDSVSIAVAMVVSVLLIVRKKSNEEWF